MSESPGTVSKILWHFTGGPRWDSGRKCQTGERKPSAEAFEALCGILSDRRINVGVYREAVSVCLPEVPFFDEDTTQTIVHPSITYHVDSAPVCCLADIPIPHLSYHAQRYGKMAIGFRRASALQHGFNPVFYTPERNELIRSIYGGLNEMRLFDISEINNLLNDLQAKLNSLFEPVHPMATPLATIVRDVSLEVTSLGRAADVTLEAFQKFLSFSKTFRDDQFNTIYCEREWRSIRPYNFKFEDVAAVMLPRSEDGADYVETFIANHAERLGLPRSIAIIAWEDLFE